MNLSPRWRVGLLVAAGLGFGLLAVLRWPPPAWPGGLWNPQREGARVPALLAQLQDPVHWDRSFQFAWSQRGLVTALRWRLLIPVVAHDLGLSPQAYLWLPWLGLAVLVGTTGWYAWQKTGDAQRTACAMGLVVTSSAWLSTTSGLGNMDPFYLTALLVGAFSPSPMAVLAACLFGPWVDERFVLALPLVAALRVQQGRSIWPLAGVLLYCAARVAALLAGDQADAGYLAGQGAAFGRFSLWLPVGWWFGWRAGWIIVLGGLWVGWRTAAPRPRMLLAAGLLGLLVIYFLAWDSSRSIAVVLPWAVFGAGQTWIPRRVLWGAVVLNYLLPAALLSATYSAQQGIVPTLMTLP